MSGSIVCCALVLLACSVPETLGALRQAPEAPAAAPAAAPGAAPAAEAVTGAVSGATSTVGNGVTGTTEAIAGALPKVPEAPLPAVAGPTIPLVGSSAPHTADPAVCGIIGCVIIANWILACCCAGLGGAGGAAAGAEAAEGDTGAAEAAGAGAGVAGSVFVCVECAASICSIIGFFYAAFTGLFRAWLGGQAVSGWCLFMAIISTLQLLACVCICCCATCCAAIIGEVAMQKYVHDHSKHVFGSHLHEMVHKHKPGGTHPITEGHLPIVGHPSGKAGKEAEGSDKAGGDATEATPLTANA